MPLNTNIKKVLVIGSGPIVIGQAAEFDYAGTQACRALKEDGIEIVLINSNPATIMTDKAMADKIYIEPMTLTNIKRIIEKEKPDSILSGLGGQTGLNLCMQLAKEGFLDKNNVTLLGAKPETIDKAEDRQLFKDTMQSINQPCIPSEVVTSVDGAVAFAHEIGFPVIIRPAFTLGGSGGGIVNNDVELLETARNGLSQSPIHQILVEKCIAGWKEIEFEVMRDSLGNVITVCSMENLDPVGIHTGDSIVIAPTVTLSDKEYQMLRSASLNIITALDIEGGCNCQFALHPTSFEYAVIEVNPRVSRSSALASKATGYPIAKVATKIAIGYTLDEITNAVTGKTYAAFEPALDYVAVKLPKWPFDKFVYAKRELGTQMKATGEVMSISDNFEAALKKAIRGAELKTLGLRLNKFIDLSEDELIELLKKNATDERIFVLYEAIYKDIPLQIIHNITTVDMWFLSKIKNIADTEKQLLISKNDITFEQYLNAKKLGFLDVEIENLIGGKVNYRLDEIYRMVDTCAGEFEANTPYFYGVFDDKRAGAVCEAESYISNSTKEKVIVLGSGPIRIGQGIEFDYASVHCVGALKKLGYEVIIINNNPETVSTDFDTGDRLYFEPLCIEDVMNIIKLEKPIGVVVAFGGGTAIKLAEDLDKNGVKIIGSAYNTIDLAEDRERFDALLESLHIARPKATTVFTTEEALKGAEMLGYPVLMRPSYVLGGQNMIIAYNQDDIKEYMAIILASKQNNAVLIDKYIIGTEIEVDAICDGNDILIPGIMEHIERTGVHSGDSIAVYPAMNIGDDIQQEIIEITTKLVKGLNAIGLVNIQYIVSEGEVYVIEVNPRASRTVPYISKVTGVPMCDLATEVSIGKTLLSLGYGTGLYKKSAYVAVKVPVFSFAKLTDVDTQLGPEMKSTGEVLGIGKSFKEALYKGLIASGSKMVKSGNVFITVKDSDKKEIVDIAKMFNKMGFGIYATEGTAKTLDKAGIETTIVPKVHEDSTNNPITLLESGKLSYIISTSQKGRNPARYSVKIRRKATLLAIPCLTSLDTAKAIAHSTLTRYSESNTELVDINALRSSTSLVSFVKMQDNANDYIIINGSRYTLVSPPTSAVELLDRRLGIGGDGLIIINKSKKADSKIDVLSPDGSYIVCANAVRIAAKYLYDNDICKKMNMTIETKRGIMNVTISTMDGKAHIISVDMSNAKAISNKSVNICGKEYEVVEVDVNSLHTVVITQDINIKQELLIIQLEKQGYKIDYVDIVKIIDSSTVEVRSLEIALGELYSSGGGAVAAAIAARLGAQNCMENCIKAKSLGGELTVTFNDTVILLSGSGQKLYGGVVEV